MVIENLCNQAQIAFQSTSIPAYILNKLLLFLWIHPQLMQPNRYPAPNIKRTKQHNAVETVSKKEKRKKVKRIAADIREQHPPGSSTLLRIAAVCIGSRLPNFREGVQRAKGRRGGQKPPGIPRIRGVRAFECVEPYNEPPQNKGCSSNPVLVSLAFKRWRALLNHVFSLWYPSYGTFYRAPIYLYI